MVEAGVSRREQLTDRERALLETLEGAVARRQYTGGWVRGNALETACGRRFGSALYRMAPLTPSVTTPGLGFAVARRRARDGSNDWEYRLTGYPHGWVDGMVSLDHVLDQGADQAQPAGADIKPGQTSLFADGVVI